MGNIRKSIGQDAFTDILNDKSNSHCKNNQRRLFILLLFLSGWGQNMEQFFTLELYFRTLELFT